MQCGLRRALRQDEQMWADKIASEKEQLKFGHSGDTSSKFCLLRMSGPRNSAPIHDMNDKSAV